MPWEDLIALDAPAATTYLHWSYFTRSETTTDSFGMNLDLSISSPLKTSYTSISTTTYPSALCKRLSVASLCGNRHVLGISRTILVRHHASPRLRTAFASSSADHTKSHLARLRYTVHAVDIYSGTKECTKCSSSADAPSAMQVKMHQK